MASLERIKMETNTKTRAKKTFDIGLFLGKADGKKRVVAYHEKDLVFSQGDAAVDLFYVLTGKVKLSVISRQGREAVVAVVARGFFFGEGCLAGQHMRISTAMALVESSVAVVPKDDVIRLLHEEKRFSEAFVAHLLSRNIEIEKDLVEQLFNSSEKRLARVLLHLADFGKQGEPKLVIPRMSQETLAEIVGTTRTKVSFFMSRFRALGFIDYHGDSLEVHTSLLSVVLHD